MQLVVPVAVCTMVRDGRVLFIRRRGKTLGGLLSLPGGKIDFGETIERAAVREFEEETGIRSRFVRHIATIPEHIVEGDRVLKHMMIQLCELEYLDVPSTGEFEPVWIALDELDSMRGEITPSDYLMLKRLLIPGKRGTFYSLMEKTGSGYVQREFREI
jgi:mutator protein MutT